MVSLSGQYASVSRKKPRDTTKRNTLNDSAHVLAAEPRGMEIDSDHRNEIEVHEDWDRRVETGIEIPQQNGSRIMNPGNQGNESAEISPSQPEKETHSLVLNQQPIASLDRNHGEIGGRSVVVDQQPGIPQSQDQDELSDKERALLGRFAVATESLLETCSSTTKIDEYIVENEREFQDFLQKILQGNRVEVLDLPPIPIIVMIKQDINGTRRTIQIENNRCQCHPDSPGARLLGHIRAARGPQPLALFAQRFEGVFLGIFFSNFYHGETQRERTVALWDLIKDCVGEDWTIRDLTTFVRRCIFLWEIFQIGRLPFLFFDNSISQLVLTSSLFNMKAVIPSYVKTMVEDTMRDVVCPVFESNPLSWLEEFRPTRQLFVHGGTNNPAEGYPCISS
jgi:hypothetical protein